MAERKRNKEDRRYGSGTRSDVNRREGLSDNWKYIEKRREEDRRSDQRRQHPNRRGEATNP